MCGIIVRCYSRVLVFFGLTFKNRLLFKNKMVVDIVRQWAKEHHYDENAITFYGKGEPRLVVVGEIHYLLPLDIQPIKDEHIDLCARLGSDTVAHEMLANHIYYPQTRILRRNGSYPVHPSSAKRLSAALEEDRIFRKSPQGYEQLMDLHYGGFFEFQEWRKKYNVGVLLDAFETRIISRIFIDYGHTPGETLLFFPPRVTKIVGCDIDYAEYLSYADLYDGDERPIIGLPKYHHIREARAAQVIGDSLRETRKPLVAILGAHHIRDERKEGEKSDHTEWSAKNSWIHESLAKMGISYVTIDQQKSKTYRDLKKEQKI